MSVPARPARPARFCVLAAGLVAGALTPLASVSVADAASDPAARADRHWHSTMVAGTGKRAVRIFTCRDGAPDNYTARFKVTTKKSSDSKYPRIEVALVDGSHTSGNEVSLFPGGRTVVWSDSPWSSAAVVKFTVHNQGKTKKKTVTVGSFGGC